MSDYDIRLDDKFGHLALIDVAREAAAHDPWFNQTLTSVNDAVIRLGVIEGDFHWHKHDDTDEFFLVLDGELIVGVVAWVRFQEEAHIWLKTQMDAAKPQARAAPAARPDPEQ